jgi:ABC-type glutathione transport system ATPase component
MSASLQLTGLCLSHGGKPIVNEASLRLAGGEIVAIVGCSGAGKTQLSRAIAGLCRLNPGVTQGSLSISLGGEVHEPYTGWAELSAHARLARFRPIQGRLISFLPQHPQSALNPMWTVGQQVQRVAALNNDESVTAFSALTQAGFASAQEVMGLYPHQLSGGMAQRVCIAQALARGSRFLIVDEPTTGLDSTLKRPLLQQFKALAEQGMGLLFITHDLRLLEGFCDRILVMDSGSICESLSPGDLTAGVAQSEPAKRLLAAMQKMAPGGHP